MKDLKKDMKVRFASIVCSLILTLTTLSAVGQNRLEARRKYIEQYAPIAMAEMREFGIPASITLAQGLLESADGTSELATEGNNHFGIKCHNDWTGKKMYHDDDAKGECFRVYEHAEASFRDHSLFLKEKKRYAVLFTYDKDDYKKWAKGLKECGYATNPKYPEMLIKLIEENELYKYDSEFEKISLPLAGGATAVILHHPSGLEYIVATKDDTWESVSEWTGKSVYRLLKYNDLKFDDKLEDGELVFLECKNRRGKEKTHVVREGETMHSISQNYGIRLEYLYKRNRMNAGEQPKVGETLVLRGYK